MEIANEHVRRTFLPDIPTPESTLDVRISRLGGAVAVLDWTRRGFDLPRQNISEIGEWDSLVSCFKSIGGGDK